MNEVQNDSAFVVKDCALATIATGQRAQNLRELSDQLSRTDPACVYHHFWGGLLRPRFDDPEYINDFAFWARHALHDNPLAERLAIIDPAEYSDLAALRQEVIDVIESRIDESETLAWARPDQMFHFVRSQIVVFDTAKRLGHPRELAGTVAGLSLGSIFYHFIDARRREPQGMDDFRVWLEQFGPDFEPIRAKLSEIDPYFTNLDGLRQRLTGVFMEFAGETP